MNDSRIFTRAEDELILAQSRGEFSRKELKRKLHSSMHTIERRADQLGLTLVYVERAAKHPRRFSPNRRPPPRQSVIYDTAENPFRIIKDKYLEQLERVHPERANRGEKL